MPNTKQCFGKMPYFSLIKAKNISLLHSFCRKKYIVSVLLLASFSYLVLFCVPVFLSSFLLFHLPCLFCFYLACEQTRNFIFNLLSMW